MTATRTPVTSTTATGTSVAGTDTVAASSATGRGWLRRTAAVLAATGALTLGLGATLGGVAAADEVVGGENFTSVVECGSEGLLFASNSTADEDSFAQIWVWDPASGEWETDGNWVDASATAGYNLADLTFAEDYYWVYVSYAQWDGTDWQFSGEYVDEFVQYYPDGAGSYDYYASDYCILGG